MLLIQATTHPPHARIHTDTCVFAHTTNAVLQSRERSGDCDRLRPTQFFFRFFQPTCHFICAHSDNVLVQDQVIFVFVSPFAALSRVLMCAHTKFPVLCSFSSFLFSFHLLTRSGSQSRSPEHTHQFIFIHLYHPPHSTQRQFSRSHVLCYCPTRSTIATVTVEQQYQTSSNSSSDNYHKQVRKWAR